MSLKPFDVYSSLMQVPFDIAAYCRMHRFSLEAVALTKAIQSVHIAEAKLAEAQKTIDDSRWKLESAIMDVRYKMAKDQT